MADDESITSEINTAYAPRRKWALTQEAFDKLLASLGEDRAGAGNRYLEVRSNLIRFFQWRGCPFPEDHADETINRVAKRIDEGEDIRNAPGYFLGVARMLLLEINRERAREHQALGEIASLQVASSDSEEPEARIECLRACLQSLSPENSELILQYYQGEKSAKIENRKRLTERFKVPVNTLRMRALRLREKLQICVEDCLNR
jgi:DNA-directed RNA polymerase specialized sigma24 family protein